MAANVYTLPAWNAADKARLQAAAQAEAAAEKARRGIGAAGDAAAPAPGAAPVAPAVPVASVEAEAPGARGLAMGAYVWVAAESQGNAKFGEVLPGVVAAVVPNAKAVHTLPDGSQVFCQCISLLEMEEFNAKPSTMDARVNKVKPGEAECFGLSRETPS